MQHQKMPGTTPSHGPASAVNRPALFARYGTLEDLRYDYPLVLVEDDKGGTQFRPLMRLIDDALGAVAQPGPAGEAQRQQVLRLEAAIRRRVAAGESGRLSDLWRTSAAALLQAQGEQPFGPMDTNLDHARERLHADGMVIGCDAATPKAVLSHAWHAVHRDKAAAFRKKVDGLILRLSDILKADFMKSDEAHGAEALKSAVGQADSVGIDFGALSGILARARPVDRLPEDRLHRIGWALSVLGGQRFYGPVRGSELSPGQPKPHSYIFESCARALDAYRERLPEMVEFVKALTTAELEAEGKYRPAQHDPVLNAYDESDLTAEQEALLPAALVLLRDGEDDIAETVRAFEALASGLPIKVLVQTDDILGTTSPEPSRHAFGGGSARLAAMAMGTNNAFALQVSSAHLYRMRDALVRGMRYDGPALFCVYSGATPSVEGVAPYLLAAAATESRAFPTFCYDPSAGPDWARRFDLATNPALEADWPGYRLDFEDGTGQRLSIDTAFSFIDFAMCDARYARYSQPIAQKDWSEKMLPAADWLKLDPVAAVGRVPYVLGINAHNELTRCGVAEKVAEAATRAIDAWRRLQELAGIRNSHAERLLAAERVKFEARTAEAVAKAVAAAAAAAPAILAPVPTAEVVAAVPAASPARAAAPAAAATAAPAASAAAAPPSDLPWIETARCTTCNECTQINAQLFAYNDNMQAYIVNPDGGSFRQLVEAAEGCQVSIIHPGKPRNPDEPDLPALIERAKAFA
jgi:hypothetical protein